MEESQSANSVKVYGYRWVILTIYCFAAAINFLQFLQYTIIANIVAKYYAVERTSVELTGLVFMIIFLVACLPINYLIKRYNLWIILSISSGLTAMGNILKLFSVEQDRFFVVLIAQLFCAFGQVFMLTIPSKIASTWFGPTQVSTAAAIAILGTQTGVAIGCVVPANIVRNSDDLEAIGTDLFRMMIINASVSGVIFLTVLIFFRSKPKFPPSQSQINLLRGKQHTILETVRGMALNPSFKWILLIFGISNGMWSFFGISFNRLYLHYFPDSEAEVGIISGIAILSGGCLGSVVVGHILDRWHRFKLTTFVVILLASILYIIVVICFEFQTKVGAFITVPIFGFFLASTLIVGFEFATEVMYPMSEAAACGVLNMIIYVFGIVFTFVFGELYDAIGYLPCHSIVFVCLLSSAGFVYFVNPNLQRREANQDPKQNDVLES